MAISTLHVTPDGNEVYIASQLSGNRIIRGKDRKGIRAGNFELETSSKRHLLDSPQVEKARILIETATVVGTDKLTAQDIAVHEYLLACARHAGIEKPAHKIQLARLSDYLGGTRYERIWDSLERLMSTVVRYHIVDPKTSHRACKNLIEDVSTSTNRLSGKTVVHYSIPGVVRDAILQSRSYTWLDINVFPKFATKYAGRLYPKLALMAGYDHRVRKPWTPTVEELARFVAYAQPGEEIHIGSFMRAIDKALIDIVEHVDRFAVTCIKPRRGGGRGRPVEGTFYFQTSDTSKSLFAYRPAVLGPAQIGKIEDRRHSPLADIEHPEIKWLAQAQSMTRIDADILSERWRVNVADAKLHPGKRFGAMSGELLTTVLDGEGVKSAFKLWVGMAVVTGDDSAFDVPVQTDETPRYSPGSVAATWIEEELWYANDYDEEDEIEDLRTAGDFDLVYGEAEY